MSSRPALWLPAVQAAAGIIIPAILFLAFRSASRVERRDEFIASLTKHINKHPLVRMHVGNLFATHAPVRFIFGGSSVAGTQSSHTMCCRMQAPVAAPYCSSTMPCIALP